MFNIVWSGESSWSDWSNIDNPGEIRIANETFVLPFNPISHQGIGNASSEVKIRYRFGQKQSLENQTGLVTMTLEIPDGSSITFSDNGIYNVNKNGYLQPSSSVGGNFRYPSTTLRGYISFWFKSNISDYSNKSFIAIYNTGISAVEKTCSEINDGDGGDIFWAIVIDENKIKAIVSDNVSTPADIKDFCISPVGGDVTIDQNWHHVMLFLGKLGSGVTAPLESILVIDNDFSSDYTSIDDSGASGGSTFNLGSTSFDTQYGFSGTIDEFVIGNWTGTNSSGSDTTPDDRFGLTDDDFQPSYRFVSNIFVSPVIDTENENNIISSIYSVFSTPNGSSVQFSFRSRNTEFQIDADNNDVPWTGFTLPGQILNESDTNLSDIGLFVRGRYVQVRVLLNPSDVNSPLFDALSIDTPSIEKIQINIGSDLLLANPSNHAYYQGTILGQIAKFTGRKNIQKVSLNLNVNNLGRRNIIEGKNGFISFQAANFQRSRNEWVFQPENHWLGGWKTSGTSIKNTLKYDSFEDEIFVDNAPFIGYELFFPESGTYDLWGYGYTDGEGLPWSFDGDTTNLRSMNLGIQQSGWYGIPRWTKFGTVYVNEGGIKTFDVYLKNNNTIILDQWFFTTDINLEFEFENIGDDAFTTPLPLSKGTFNTALRLRKLSSSGGVNGIDNPLLIGTSITSWLTSNKILESGKYNYEIRNNINNSGVYFDEGVSMEFWQIGGSKDFFASWNYIITENSIGDAFKSINYGQSYEY